ncbi:Phospholipase D1 [Hypsibius exemplaris]|uniref:Phospholipase n=1 Tax=Hypsibius exemplaris TaxID=2072580 RepID=A0A1W0WBU5_HYPEX|nr:Phospholipase D1 [Hypsibius exemplaris]
MGELVQTSARETPMDGDFRMMRTTADLDEFGRNETTGSDDENPKDHLSSDLKPRLPALPKRIDFFITPEQLEGRRVKLEHFFQSLLNTPLWREHPETLRFLEVSELSFMGELGEKGKEMPLQKLSGRVRIPICCSQNNTFCDILSRWKERWILVKDTYYAYMSTNSSRIANVLLFDRDIKIEHDRRYSVRHSRSIVVRNSTRDLVLKFGQQRDLDDWLKYFQYVLSTSAAQFVRPHPYGSSFPVRDNVPAKWFIDGAPYMSAVADALELAEEEIFITDWWLSPEIYMKRPITEGERWRLDRILQRRAEAGVKIYVMLYKEVPIALGINSHYSKAVLTSRHPNIKVQRHPDHLGQNIWLWSHHEKTVIVDQKIGFFGGIDLCYGRWDDHLYRLTDTGPIDGSLTAADEKEPLDPNGGTTPTSLRSSLPPVKEDAPPEEVELQKRPEHRDTRSSQNISAGRWRMGQPFKAANATDAQDKTQSAGNMSMAALVRAAQNKAAEDKPASTDIMNMAALVRAVQNKAAEERQPITGRPSRPFGRRSISMPAGRSNNVNGPHAIEAKVRFGDDMVAIHPSHKKTADKKDSPKFRRRTKMLQNAIRLTRTTSQRGPEYVPANTSDETDGNATEADLDKMNIKVSGRLWLGKDYCNEVRKAFSTESVEKPDDDQLDRNEVPRMPWHDIGGVMYEHGARDLARHFIQRWNACKVEKNRRDDNYTFLVPKSYDTCDVSPSILKGSHSCRTQVLRSVCSWSAGLQPGKVEDSIHQAYIQCIQSAKHYIYIENQFFITLDGDKRSVVANGIGEALFQRLKRAFMNNETFRVYVVMPMKPGIEGEYGTDAGAAVQAVTHWNYQSICRGGVSLCERLEKLGADPWKYLSFCGMRTYGEIDGKLVSELIYIHSKLMIVDDLYAIIGSANINDRSMLGLRDSEIGVLIKDREFDDSMMNCQPFRSGQFCGRLRRRLMKICLGTWNDRNSDAAVADAISEEFFHGVWNATALRNEQIYEEVFGSLPADFVSDFLKLTDWGKKQHLYQTEASEAKERLKDIKGYLCKLSLDFLKDENLTPAFRTRESYLPSYFWT